MSEHSDLSKVIFSSRESDHWGYDAPEIMSICERLATHILAAGYTKKPRTVTTVEELDALPHGSVVMSVSDGETVVARKPPLGAYSPPTGGFWEKVGSELGTLAEDIIWDGPATIIYTPTDAGSET
ncbi:hypothetical protein [Cryobacterium arcticum]|uniref:Uncharacterized protein n=1 Tax=Cryobacterium arcticum TaxID=670052 RepID=A0A1B1BPQ4_9MICO|nr:hypothetical protein [Cryobacterium arcticum]ANP74518.1 hypothetical protein PA27867_3599 [Cryobacterium arcticum]